MRKQKLLLVTEALSTLKPLEKVMNLVFRYCMITSSCECDGGDQGAPFGYCRVDPGMLMYTELPAFHLVDTPCQTP